MRLDHWVLAKIQAFRSDEEGASAIEYALIAAMVAVAIAAFAGPVNEKITDIFQAILDGFGSSGN